jgi:hypothetical protein
MVLSACSIPFENVENITGKQKPDAADIIPSRNDIKN